MTPQDAKAAFLANYNEVALEKDNNGNYICATPAFSTQQEAEDLVEAYTVARQYIIDNA